MNAIELAEGLHIEWKNDSLNYDTALEAAAMLRKQAEAINVLREALKSLKLMVHIDHLNGKTFAKAEQALKDTEEFK